MMETLRQYLLSVILAAMICAVAQSLIPSDRGKTWIRMLCGLILTVTVIRPLTALPDLELDILDPAIWSTGKSISARGEKNAADAMAAIIKERCETYILDKADTLGISVTAQIALSDDTIPAPVSVTLSGSASPSLRRKLEAMIQEDIGITKENLRWKE